MLTCSRRRLISVSPGVASVRGDAEQMDDGAERTVLKRLLVQRHLQRYETFRVEYVKAAGQIAPELRRTAPSRAQYYRWLSGELKGGLPYPDACRVLEALFPPWTASELFIVTAEGGAPLHGERNLLAGVAQSFSITALDGAWVTAYRFGNPTKHHVDIAHVVAASDRMVRVRNFPPEPRTEAHSVPYRNEIEAELVNRHLIGVWKNTIDTRYFGTLHLAVLPGEAVMEGYYTGFNSDIEVGLGPWKWVKLAPQSLAGADLSQVELQEPGKVYGLLDSHSQYDAPLTLNEILEDR
jgi:hypothetical protein